jgi:Zn finger protein HypA/HybF involved in hydrogenase expression
VLIKILTISRRILVIFTQNILFDLHHSRLRKPWCMRMCCALSIIIYDVCPDCGNGTLEVNAGKQMRIKELEVE